MRFVRAKTATAGYEFSVPGLISAVEMRGTGQKTRPGRITAEARRFESMKHRHHGVRAVDHSGIDYLTTPGGSCMQNRAQHAKCQEHAATAEVTNQV
jgi:hypothetical protein